MLASGSFHGLEAIGVYQAQRMPVSDTIARRIATSTTAPSFTTDFAQTLASEQEFPAASSDMSAAQSLWIIKKGASPGLLLEFCVNAENAKGIIGIIGFDRSRLRTGKTGAYHWTPVPLCKAVITGGAVGVHADDSIIRGSDATSLVWAATVAVASGDNFMPTDAIQLVGNQSTARTRLLIATLGFEAIGIIPACNNNGSGSAATKIGCAYREI